MSFMKKLQKATVVENSAAMDKSSFFNARNLITLPVPVMNLAYSGRLDGGFSAGMHLVCGPSKHFKSNLCMVACKAFQDKYEDSVIIFYDSEFGSLPEYWENAHIDISKVLHVPVKNMEELKFDIMKKLEAIEAGIKEGETTKVMFYVDSLGNLASKKEIEDALKESGAADMTRAKVGKSLARMITPYLKLLDIPFFGIQHTYCCGTEKMYVLTPDRGEVSLKDIQVGDSVVTENGIEQVLSAVSYDEAPICEIELEDGTILEFTSGHRFKVNGEWKFVDELEPGDVLDKI